MVTVAVLDHIIVVKTALNERDLKIEWYSGTGAGGQHRNKHQNSIRLTHVPSGLTETSQCRSREASYAAALVQLTDRVNAAQKHQITSGHAASRKEQVGSGDRGSYVRSYCYQHGTVKDRVSGQQITIKQFEQGMLQLLR